MPSAGPQPGGRQGNAGDYQIGPLDVCDTPCPETTGVLRDVGGAVYRRRLGER
ncbi:MAG: hypothetical protein ACOCWL_03770 [Thermoguttaceae bacterium]